MPQMLAAVSPRPIVPKRSFASPSPRNTENSATMASVTATSVHAMSESLCLTKPRDSRTP